MAAIAHETSETVRRIGERENMRPSLAWPRTIKTVYGDDTFPNDTSPVPERTTYARIKVNLDPTGLAVAPDGSRIYGITANPGARGGTPGLVSSRAEARV